MTPALIGLTVPLRFRGSSAEFTALNVEYCSVSAFSNRKTGTVIQKRGSAVHSCPRDVLLWAHSIAIHF